MKKLVEKILKYRIFSDENDHMNLSLRDVQGGLLLISQFTLAANTNSGLRPSFDTAMIICKAYSVCQAVMASCRMRRVWRRYAG